MPKIKTRRCAAKRFSVTGSGKFKRRRKNMRHILTKKASKRKMQLGQPALVDKDQRKGCQAHAALSPRAQAASGFS